MVIVEVCLNGIDPRDALGRMGVWFDQRNVVQSALPMGMAFEVGFTAAGDAEAFAEEFGGQVLALPGSNDGG